MTSQEYSTKWPTLAAFYAADPRRHAVEVEVGSDWKTAEDPAGSWRAAWLPTTGEVYIANVGDRSDPNPGPVEVLGVLPDRYTLDVGLRGWWHSCGTVGSLDWLRRTVTVLAAPDC